MLGQDNREIELKDEKGNCYFRRAYIIKNKNIIKLNVYGRLVADIDIKSNQKNVFVDFPSQITKKQIERFFKQFEGKNGKK